MIGILGGTFDPIHHGHLRLALEMLDGLGMDEIRLIPARQPPHREQPLASAEDRRAMLDAAVRATPGLCVDTRELARDGPSYTVDTLGSFRAEFPRHPLCLILGMDAFCELDTWHRWQRLPELAHIGVARRPGAAMPESGKPAELLREHFTDNADCLRRTGAGYMLVRDIPPLDITATRIRSLLAADRNPRYLLPDAVLDVIHERGLYRASS